MSKLDQLREWVNKVNNGEYKESVFTAVEEAIIKYGAENIFLVSSDYHGLYQDDNCIFQYYNNVTGDIFLDEWSTAYAAPAYRRFENCLTFEEAQELNLFNKEIALQGAKERLTQLYTNITKEITQPMAIKYHLEVKVTRGRKWKGTGIIKDVRRTMYQYARPSFRTNNPYWGKKVTDIAIIYDNNSNKIEEVNYEYCVPVKFDEIIDSWRKEILGYVEKATNENLNGLTIRIPEYLKWENFVARYANELPDDRLYMYPAQEARDAKEKAFKEKKIAELTEWAKNYTDVKAEEIPEFVERVYNKRYGKSLA